MTILAAIANVFMLTMTVSSSTAGFHSAFKSGLPASVQNSVDAIYNNMLVNKNILMRPAQVKNAFAVIVDNNTIKFTWGKNSYAKDTTTYIDYRNQETGYKLYRRAVSTDTWLLIATIPNTDNSYTYSHTNAYKYQYYVSSYNSSGNSCGETLLLNCNYDDNYILLNNKTYSGNANLKGCYIDAKNTIIQNNANVIFKANEINIEDNFEVKEGSVFEAGNLD